LFCTPIEEQCALDEFATVKAGENAFAPEIKNLSLKALAPNDPLFMWFQGRHLPSATPAALIADRNRISA
jgi:hypothetical protein